MWKRPRGPFPQRRWSNRLSYLRTKTDQVESAINEVFAFFGPVVFTCVVGPTGRPGDLAALLVARGLVDVGERTHVPGREARRRPRTPRRNSLDGLA